MSDRARNFRGPTARARRPAATTITDPTTGPSTGPVAAGLVAAGLIVAGLPFLAVQPVGAAQLPPGLRTVRHAHAHARAHGNDHGGGHGRGATQSTGGTGTSSSPSIGSPARQVATGRRNVNAPAANSAVTFAGIQQVSSVSVFTNTVNGNCRRGINRCVINQTLRAVEGRGGRAHAG
ncbi:hypothetical protein [Microbispora triticiradicis]|uniref:DUF320 domain-containing protein n=2 Tax=Microbispora TaxID=2005 RepID=A0ABY3M0D2_9ACTN|nr:MULTISPECIES: hypothetical protein [Microbispora]TLP53525.1 hypothetical protein FED44_29225 [Microbispora fusca]TYB61173.1 hypothetical protein FXF59_12210 [Microbispora tritici]